MMKIYPTVAPSLTGILTDDYLSFEGVTRPAVYFSLRDGGMGEYGSEESIFSLEQYFNDLYNLFLRRLTSFASGIPTSEEETLKLQALLQEMIKTKALIENAGKADIMGE